MEFSNAKTYLLRVFQLKAGDLLAKERLFLSPINSLFSVNNFILDWLKKISNLLNEEIN